GDADCLVLAELDDVVVELELHLAAEHEVELFLGLVPVAVRPVAAGVLRHPPVRESYLLSPDRVRDPAHLARVVAQPVVDVLELHDLVLSHRRLPPLVCQYSNTWRRRPATGSS